MKNQKDLDSYSLWSNIGYTIRIYWKIHKTLIFWATVGVLAGVLFPFAEILMPKTVIDELTAKVTPAHFCLAVGGLALIIVLLGFLKRYTDVFLNEGFGIMGVFKYFYLTEEKRLLMDYEMMEDPGVKKLEDKAEEAVNNNHTPAMNLPRALALLAVNVLGFLLYGGVITSVQPLILLLLILSAAVNWGMVFRARKYEEKTRTDRSRFFNRLGYLNKIMQDPEMAKDIRLYSMAGWLHRVFQADFAKREKLDDAVAKRTMAADLTEGLFILLRDGAAYAYLVYLLLAGKITLGNFTLVFAAIGTFATWVSGIILQASELFRASSQFSDLRRYMENPDRSNTGKGVLLPDRRTAPGIRLEHVSYAYSNAAAPALENVDVIIKPGERIAVVGVNGAGKTTLVKLLCGLYRPTEGRILLNGEDIGQFNRDEYFTLFAPVFQDIHLLTTDIAGNISQQLPERTDYERLETCLKLAGLHRKVQALPLGVRTPLVKNVNEDAVELSGGEKQKLALARAIYKDAPVIILDEPTAALDPIAENEIYQKYAKLTEGKTSIYISHRLASTRFCDRILFLDGHTIAEEGTHDELMRRGGKYAEMFRIQAKYYERKAEVPAHE